MKYSEIVRVLADCGIDNPEFEAGMLISEIEGVPGHELVFRKNEDFSSERLCSAVERRKKREPLQYILGYWYFYGLKFSLNSDCLCPREDTELLVDKAVSLLPQGAKCIDIGTGSGAIAVALLHSRPDLRCLCVDISQNALECAKKNAEENGVSDRCSFVLCDALDVNALSGLGRFDGVLSNPPYIKSGAIDALAPELSYEPHRALDGGGDGMIFYRSIMKSDILSDNGVYIFEIGYDEAGDISELAATHNRECRVYKDLGGNDRVAVVK